MVIHRKDQVVRINRLIQIINWENLFTRYPEPDSLGTFLNLLQTLVMYRPKKSSTLAHLLFLLEKVYYFQNTMFICIVQYRTSQICWTTFYCRNTIINFSTLQCFFKPKWSASEHWSSNVLNLNPFNNLSSNIGNLSILTDLMNYDIVFPCLYSSNELIIHMRRKQFNSTFKSQTSSGTWRSPKRLYFS